MVAVCKYFCFKNVMGSILGLNTVWRQSVLPVLGL